MHVFPNSDIYSTTPRLAESLDNIVTLGSAQSSLYNGMGGHHANPGCIVNGVVAAAASSGGGVNGQRAGRNSASAETSGTSLSGSVLPVTTITTTPSSSASTTSLSLTNHLDSLTDTPNKGRQGRRALPFYANFCYFQESPRNSAFRYCFNNSVQ